MKSLAKDIITKCVLALPWGGRNQILNALLAETDLEDLAGIAKEFGVDSFNYLGALAQHYGICSFSAHGDYGLVHGLPRDSAILAVYAREKVWAKESNELFKSHLASGGTYLDIGGNIGLTTIPIAQNPDVVCHAFEPVPQIFEFLNRNAGHFPNVQLYNMALYNEDTEIEFETSPVNGGDNRISSGAFDNQVRVAARRLDGLEIDILGPLAVKIDTQGAEPFVLEGGKTVLSRASLVSIEYSPGFMERLGADSGVVLNYLESFSEGCVQPGDSGGVIIWEPMSVALSRIDRTDDDNYFDIFARR